MRIRALEIFVELAQSESIRQLARAQGVKPSVISRQIESVEYFFRAELFDRNAEGIKLTEAGRLLLAHARDMLGSVRQAQALVDDLRGLERGEVVIHASGAPAVGILAPVVADLHIVHPGLRFTVHQASANDVFNAVADGDADLGLTMFSPETSKVDMRLSVAVDHALIVAADHPLAARDRVSLRDLAGTPLALPEKGFGARKRLDDVAREAGMAIEPVFVASGLAIQKELATRGVAALILPPICCRREIDAGLLRAIPLDCGDAFVTSIDLCCTRGRAHSFATRKLVAALTRAMAGSAGGSAKRAPPAP